MDPMTGNFFFKQVLEDFIEIHVSIAIPVDFE